MSEDFYSRLGVGPEATQDEILRAYREKVSDAHPDVSDDPDAGEQFKRLSRAKSVLSDPERRRRYDRLGHERFVENTGAETGTGPDPARPGADVSRGAERRGASRSGPKGFDTLFEHVFGHASQDWPAGRTASANVRQRRGEAGGDPFAVNLEPLLRRPHTSRSRRGDETGEAANPDGGDGVCPKCRGRGSFEHVLDTALGRRRRLEPCERCDGTGALPE